MTTENLDIEYSIFFLLFTKERESVLIKLMEKGIQPDYFAPIFHREIYTEILELYKSKKSLLSLSMFQKHFLDRPGSNSDDSIKLKSFVQQIKDAKIAPADLPHAIDLMTEKYVTRKVLGGINISIDDLNRKPIGDILDDLQATYKTYRNLLDTDTISRVMGLKEGFDRRVERAKEVKANPDAAGMVCTGLKNLDKFIGRQSPGQFVIYQARTGVGKSMMLMGTAIANFKRGLKVMVITIEMSDYDYLYRFDSNLTGIEHREFVSGDITEEEDKVTHWKNRIMKSGPGEHDLMVYWVPSQCTPAKVESLITNNPFKPDVLIVDYAGDMKAGLKGVPDYDARSHAEIYSSLKEFAGKYNCVVYTAQQSKRGTGGKANTESGAWSDVASGKADIMMAIEVTKEDEDFITEVDGNMVIGRMTVSIVKGRNIPKCKTHIIPRFKRMNWLEKESDEMIPCGSGKEIKTGKKEAEEKIAGVHEELNRAMEADSDEDIDLLGDD